MAEKMSVMAYLENKYLCRQADMDEAWRTLMLAQHHDSWIVPYNGLNRKGTCLLYTSFSIFTLRCNCIMP